MSAARRGPRTTSERLRRLLVMLPWLMERNEVAVDEMAARFEISEAELVRDLEMASVCGLPPFVDEMIDVWIDEGMVHVGIPRLFLKPLRLTAPEGFALLASGRAAMQLPGAEPGGALDRALTKLAEALGDDGQDDGLVIDAPRPPGADDFAAAAVDNARLRVAYRTADSDVAGERELTPRAVFLDRGQWYVVADDHRSGEERTFRLDRMERWERTGAIDEPRAVTVPSGDDWFVDSGLPSVTLRLAPEARWVAERFPVLEQRIEGTAVVVRVAVTSERWLRGLLLRLGTFATVIEPAEWQSLGADAAAGLLARYEATGS